MRKPGGYRENAWSAEDLSRLDMWWQEGKGIEWIARKLNRSERAIRSKLERAGIQRERNPNAMDAGDVELAYSLRLAWEGDIRKWQQKIAECEQAIAGIKAQMEWANMADKFGTTAANIRSRVNRLKRERARADTP